MAKTKKTLSAPVAPNSSALAAPFSLESFRADIVEVYFHYVRTIGWITDPKTAWQITNLSPLGEPQSIFDPEQTAADLGIRYEQIRHTPFARALEHLYEFAFFGRRDASAEAMRDESYYTWVTDIVRDAADSHIGAEWSAYGNDTFLNARRCVQVAETANARHILEGGEPFSYFSSASAQDESATEGVLTIRQMALLSGMEEMSIRAAANPKRANPLKTHTENRSTRIAIDVAKEWLQSKGLYIPITSYHSAGDVDLAKRGFTTYLDLWYAINSRFLMIADRDGQVVLSKKLATIGLQIAKGAGEPQLEIDEAHYLNEELIRSLASILELPDDLLVLRCKETVATEQLADVSRQLKKVVFEANSSKTN